MPHCRSHLRRARALAASRTVALTSALVGSLVGSLVAAGPPRSAAAQATTTRPRTTTAPATAQPAGGQWTPARARAWYDSTGWVVGANFVPSTAINQLEMWQAATWDPATIDRELGWAQSLGMNTMRVFLHDQLWTQDSTGFLRRMDEFLTIAARHNIRPMLVFFDSVWDPFPQAGPQRAPYPHLHNSGWVQSPGRALLADTARHDALRPYVQGVVARFANDRRVLAWDLFNEPDNINRPAYFALEPRNKAELALALLRKQVAWVRAARPSQPITMAPWHGDWSEQGLTPIDRFMFDNSDVITFHSYDDLPTTRRKVETLRRYDRPLLATEYMARPTGSTFGITLPYFKQARVGAYNWGFVAGRSQTIYPWDSWTREYAGEPALWFHDVFRADGTAYDQGEVMLIRALTGAAQGAAAPAR
jgi:hypothetical protein